jgi:Zn-dependent peptidase ImmA (M78 family)
VKSLKNRYLARLCSFVGEAEQATAVRKLVSSYRETGQPLHSVASKLGIAEIRREPLPFDGGVFEEGSISVIKINSLRNPVRCQFTLAHELGHLMLSSSIAKKKQKNCSDDPNLERACDSIAAELLMPYEETVQLVAQMGHQSPEKLGIIARRFGVSLETAARRLHTDLKLWKLPMGLWEYGATVQELWFVGKRPWRSREQSFSAFDLARESHDPIVTRERYPVGAHTELVDLKVLHLGNNKILGIIAT